MPLWWRLCIITLQKLGKQNNYNSPLCKRRRFTVPFKSPLTTAQGSGCETQNAIRTKYTSSPSCTSSDLTPDSISSSLLTSTSSNTHTPQCRTIPGKAVSLPKTRTLKRKVLNTKFKSPVATSSASREPITPNKDRELEEASEELRRLQLVEYHRVHNDLNTLKRLTEVWRDAGHKVLHQLHDTISTDPKPTLAELQSALRIPAQHMQCNCDV